MAWSCLIIRQKSIDPQVCMRSRRGGRSATTALTSFDPKLLPGMLRAISHEVPSFLRPVVDAGVWKLFGVLHRADARLNALWWTTIVAGAGLPVALITNVAWLLTSIASDGALLPPILLICSLFIAMNTLAALGAVVSANLGARTGEYLYRRLERACLTPDGIAHMERPDLGSALSAARDFDLGITGAPLVISMPRIAKRLTATGAGLTYAAILSGFHLWSALLLAVAWLSTHVLLRKSSRWEQRFSEEVMLEQQLVRYTYDLMVEAAPAKEVRLFGLARWLGDTFRGRRLSLLDRAWAERPLRLPALSVSIVAVLVANAVVFATLARAATSGSIDLAQTITFVLAAIGTSLLGFDDDYFLRASAQSISPGLQIIDAMQKSGRITSGLKRAAGLPAASIRFEDVHFTYPGSGKPVLRGLDLSIPAGSSVAIVGANGAGKTTVAKLLGRLYEPTGGRITVDGVPVEDFELSSWRAQLACVFQDFVRYDWSLRDNVAAGADDELISSALKSAEADGIAELDQPMSRSQGGVALSGGQWQRIALARVLASIRRGARVIVLDEPTAQLDVRSEATLFDRLLQETRELTTILISHRLSTVRKVDLICVLEDGRVAEIGSHEELMRRAGPYRRMFEMQRARFAESEDGARG
jgi:ATP-binding cassette, subfamily B, bacterial